MSFASGGSNYTIVQTVFKFGSNRTALPSTDFALVLYMGFSKAACPLLFSWTEQPVYWVFGVVLLDQDNAGKQKTWHQNKHSKKWKHWTVRGELHAGMATTKLWHLDSPLLVEIKSKACKYQGEKRHKDCYGHRATVCTMWWVRRIITFRHI